jgi:hypothetical protein
MVHVNSGRVTTVLGALCSAAALAFAASLGFTTTAHGDVSVARPAPRPGSIKLEPLREPDPGGGPPWGVRTFVSPSGRTCHDVGRIVGGRLGEVAADGSFTEQGITWYGCPTEMPPYLDTWEFRVEGAPTNLGPGTCAELDPPSWVSQGTRCTVRESRTVLDGMFGPGLVRALYAKPDGTGVRELDIGRYGVIVAVWVSASAVGHHGWGRDGEPIVTLVFDRGCRPAGKLQRVTAHRGCRRVQPDILGSARSRASWRAVDRITRLALRGAR